jgi:hypothetical protein
MSLNINMVGGTASAGKYHAYVIYREYAVFQDIYK